MTDLNGNTLEVTASGHSSGVRVAFERDSKGRITKITEPSNPGSSKAPGELKYTYDSKGNLISFTAQSGAVMKYSYTFPQFPNYLSKIEDALGRAVARNVIDSEGRLIGICDTNGAPATLNGCTKLEPVASASKQTIFNARGFKTEMFLDERGNVLRERRWLDATNFLDTVRTYDANNNMLTDTDPAGNVKKFTYDDRSNRLTATDPGGRTTTYTYNAGNKVTTVTDPAGNVTKYGYDAKDNLISVTNAMNSVMQYKYNAQGQRSEMIDAINNSWKWGYDANGNLQTWTDPFGKSVQFTFNANGELLTRIDRNNRRIDFEYDSSHRPVKESWDTTPKRITTYTYNALGQLTNAVDPDSALAIVYDTLGRQKSVDNQGTPGAPHVVISYAYDPNENVTHVRDSLGGVTEYAYDALDRMNKVMQYGTNVNEKRVDMVYDNASFLREMQRFSNLGGTQGATNTSFDYDCGGCGGRVSGIHHRKASDNSVIHDLGFQRDELGNIITAIDAEGTHIYTYDSLRRLKAAAHSQSSFQPNEFYMYDAVGNRLTSHLRSSYSYTSGGLLQDSQFNYQYGDEGNLISRINRATNAYIEYLYDHRNRLSRLTDKNANGLELQHSEYIYDTVNRRIRLEENVQVAHFFYDKQNPVLRLSNTPDTITRRLYSQSTDGILADEMASTSRWFLSDHLGTVCDLVGSAGNLLNHYTYDSFGQLLSQSNPSVFNDILFTSREFDKQSGLSYFRARFYDASVGRFLQEDAFGPFQYIYAVDNPLSFLDPSGQTVLNESGVNHKVASRQSFNLRTLGCLLRKNFIKIAIHLIGIFSQQEELTQPRLLPPKKEDVIECVIDKKGTN